MTLFRLDSVAPVAAERFRQAASSQRREAVRVACDQAVAAADLTAPEVDEALAVLRGVALVDGSLRERLEILATRYDEQYFQLDQDDEEKLQAHSWFAKARAASALAYGMAADDGQLHEALYESIYALDEPSELLRFVDRILS